MIAHVLIMWWVGTGVITMHDFSSYETCRYALEEARKWDKRMEGFCAKK